MTIWHDIWEWLACRDPDDIDSDFEPNGTRPISEEDRAKLWAPPTVPITKDTPCSPP